VRSIYANSAALRRDWSDPEKRAEIVRRLEERGISFAELKTATSQPDADPFDLLCHVTFSAPLKTCRERAERLRRDERKFFEKYQPEARKILDELLEKYAEHGVAQFTIPEVLKLPPISNHGNVMEIASKFGGAEKLREAVGELQALIYAP
jgi:type I restriction enzyme R subunit